MTDNPTPASLRSLGSDDDEPRVPAGTSQVVYPWIDRITVTAEGEITIPVEALDALDPDDRNRIIEATRLAAGDSGDLLLGAIAKRRTHPESWGYSTSWQDPAIDGSRLYPTALVAAQACALQVLDGTAARMSFDCFQPTA
jgi:hypothetical protein